MRIAFLISGGGTTMEAIIKAIQEGRLTGITPALVIASKPEAGGIVKARALGIPEKDIVVIDPKSFESREAFGEKIIFECHARKVNFIGQYGWMVKTPDNVIKAFEGRIINQHPGPLETGKLDFGGAGMYGMRVHAARLCFARKTNQGSRPNGEAGRFWTEATTHFVTGEFDRGAVIKRKQIPILPDDTPESLQARLLPIEHEVQIEVLQDFVNGTVAEFYREEPLIRESEETILEECKEEAKKLYPNG